mgnify:CR=1 FL=1
MIYEAIFVPRSEVEKVRALGLQEIASYVEDLDSLKHKGDLFIPLCMVSFETAKAIKQVAPRSFLCYVGRFECPTEGLKTSKFGPLPGVNVSAYDEVEVLIATLD